MRGTRRAIGALEVLQDAIDVLAAVDPSELEDAELHALVIAVQRERARLGLAAAASGALGCPADLGGRRLPHRRGTVVAGDSLFGAQRRG